jgi:hypothetical protein
MKCYINIKEGHEFNAFLFRQFDTRNRTYFRVKTAVKCTWQPLQTVEF